MVMSAFGVEDGRISKASNREQWPTTSAALGGAAGGYIGHAYGRPYKRWGLTRISSEGVHSYGAKKATVLGAGAGAVLLGSSALKHNREVKDRATLAAARKASRANRNKLDQ